MGSFGNVEIENRVNVKINSKREEENKVCFGRKEERRNTNNNIKKKDLFQVREIQWTVCRKRCVE